MRRVEALMSSMYPVVSCGLFWFEGKRDSCFVFGCRGAEALMSGIYTVFALPHS